MKYAAKRIAMLLFTMVIVSLLAFVAFDVISGDPATAMLGTQATPERVAELRAELGLDRPLLVRYGEWLLGFFTGNLGTSYSYHQPVWELIAPKVGVTLCLSLLSFALIAVISVPLGVRSATRRSQGILSGAETLFNQLCMAVPPFFTAILLTFCFSTVLRWFVHGSFPGLGSDFFGSLRYLLFAAVSVSAQDYHIKLWDNTTAPTSNGVTGDEYERKPGTLTNTSSAEIWIYKPAPEKATGQAIVFCPGGGYSQLSIANGHNTCKWFAENGIVGVMLKYRLPNGHSEVPLDDLDKAVATVREMAGELGVDPHKVGVAGTSAGGYLAGSAGVMSESKPDFMVLIYPVVSSDPDKRHLGTFQQLVGKENVETEAAKFSLEKVVDSTACPALIFHSDDDKVVPAINAALLYEKLKANGVKASLHIFPSGGHGWGMSKKFKYHENFKAATLDWLKVINAEADKATAKK